MCGSTVISRDLKKFALKGIQRSGLMPLLRCHCSSALQVFLHVYSSPDTGNNTGMPLLDSVPGGEELTERVSSGKREHGFPENLGNSVSSVSVGEE